MFRRDDPEVLVAGAGPVGLYATLALAQAGVDVRVVDRDWRTGAHSYSLALHAKSLELLDKVGLRADVTERAYFVDKIGFYDGPTRCAELPLPASEKDAGVAVLRQDALEHLLEGAIRAAGGKVEWNHEVASLTQKANRVGVTVDQLTKESVGYGVAQTEWAIANSSEVQVPLVLAADGHRSSVRRMLNIDFDEIGPPIHFAVFEFKTDVDLNHEMRVVMGQNTTDAVWPLPDGYCRWSFELADYGAPQRARVKDRIALQLGASQYPLLSDEQLQSLLGERAPWFDGNVEEVTWRLVVRFERRLAASFGEGRTWLAGDAGHVTGPVGMQSMNVGLREADDLVGAFKAVLRENQPLEQLEEYNRQRLAEWRGLLGIDGGSSAGLPSTGWFADRLDFLRTSIPASGDELDRLLKKLVADS